MTQVYLMSQFYDRHRLRHVRTTLETDGIAVLARWIDQEEAELTPADAQRWLQHDLDDLRAADVCLAWSFPCQHGHGTGGRHVELGYALALQKPILLIGSRENVFHHHPGIHLVAEETYLSVAVHALAWKTSHAVIDSPQEVR
jgi:nucleoside 2-deoxyribosyltransferase